MKMFINRSLLIFVCSLTLACSDTDTESNNEQSSSHVWQEQTATMDRAREVEGVLQDAEQKNRSALEQSTQ